MVNLTFGEQVKIILGRRGMTIKELAERMGEKTGKPMSRQNMTQRLGRDNFQEQDMRLIAEILGCKFQLSIMEMEEELPLFQQEVTVEEVLERHPEAAVWEKVPESEAVQGVVQEEMAAADQKEAEKEAVSEESEERKLLKTGIKGVFKKTTADGENTILKAMEKKAQEPVSGEINPYTGKEYKSNSVRMHPKRIGYVQVYNQEEHKWTDMTEWAFLGTQERKKALLGKDYIPPTYLD